MSFSQKLAGKYVLSQKRHSVFTLLSITAAVLFITVMFTLFASFWDTMRNAYREKSPWHAMVADLTEEEAQVLIDNEFVAEHEFEKKELTVSGEKKTITNLYLTFTRDVHDPSTLIRELTDLPTNRYEIHQNLLNFEVIGIHAKANLVLALAFLYIFIFVFIICARFIIDTAFEISSKEREVQFGILASLGASRKQIVRVILWEGIYLSIIAIPVGILLGIGISYLIFDAVLSSDVLLSLLNVEQHVGQFSAPLLYMLMVAVTALIWVMLSAYGTGMRFAKKSPIEVIRHSTQKIVKVKKSRILGKLGGIVGTLASRNVRRDKKRFAITVISITLSVVLTVVMTSIIDYTDKTIRYFRSAEDMVRPLHHYSIDYTPEGFSYDTYTITSEDIRNGYELLEKSDCFDKIQCGLGLNFYVYMDDLSFRSEYIDNYPIENKDTSTCIIEYYNEEYYNFIFDGNPPVPYSELNGGNYVVCAMTKNSDHLAGESPIDYEKDGSFTGKSGIYVTEDNLKEGDDAKLAEDVFDENGNPMYLIERDKLSGNIIACGTPRNIESYPYMIRLIGSEDDYLSILDNPENDERLYYPSFSVTLNERMMNNLQIADKLIREYVEEHPQLYILYSDIDHIINTERVNSAMKILSTAIILVITTIALINEINIISTGILNRRREIASLRALGMSGRQLTGMMLIECGLYSVISSIATLLICEPLVYYINSTFITGQEQGAPVFSYIVPVIAVLIILIPVFGAGILTTFISISGFKKKPISEEMKTVE